MNTHVDRAIKFFLSQAEMARTLGVSQPTVSEWLRGERPVPESRCAQIERITKGEVACEDLRSDVVWRRIKDKSWPWHAKGRPLVDLTGTDARQAAEVS